MRGRPLAAGSLGWRVRLSALGFLIVAVLGSLQTWSSTNRYRQDLARTVTDRGEEVRDQLTLEAGALLEEARLLSAGLGARSAGSALLRRERQRHSGTAAGAHLIGADGSVAAEAGKSLGADALPEADLANSLAESPDGQGALMGPMLLGGGEPVLIALAPRTRTVTYGVAPDDPGFVATSVAFDSLAARAGFYELAASGLQATLAAEANRSVAWVRTEAGEPMDPVTLQWSVAGREMRLAVSPRRGWGAERAWFPGLMISLVLAAAFAWGLWELTYAPVRALASVHRLRLRVRDANRRATHEFEKRRDAERKAKERKNHDRVTGLPNRKWLLEQVARTLDGAPEDGVSHVMLALSVDRFQDVSNTLGDQAGEALLSGVAERLSNVVRSRDCLAGLQGDRFGLLIEASKGNRDGREIAERIQSALDEPIRVPDHQIFTSVSVGVAPADPGSRSGSEVLREAEAALTEARRLGRGRIVVFDPEIRERAADDLILRRDLRAALERGEFWVAYQPVVAVPEGKVVGVEALARWNHPLEGAVSPARFIPIAEEDGFIVRFNRWQMRETAELLARWLEEGVVDPGFYVSVNVAPQELDQPDFTEFVVSTLAETGVPPESLRLELTERLLMNDPVRTAKTMVDLQQHGVRFMLDDFGTGYSSLSYLYQFPFYTLKIDRAFVVRIQQTEEERGIVRAMVDLSRTLGMTTVAEGVEDIELVEELVRLGCDAIQGYVYSRPRPAHELREWFDGLVEAGGRVIRVAHAGTGRADWIG